ncbi:unannotated protein [freshwater metagenome]|uniref:Unannotated protein n=1 Tax=freshwater metagenome TaxID=449393 RepID=A0A6J7NPV8_9ZZZZ
MPYVRRALEIWGSGFFQCAEFLIATIANPPGPAHARESKAALSHRAGNGMRAPDAVASTAISKSSGKFLGRALIAPDSPFANCSAKTELSFIAAEAKLIRPSGSSAISLVAP